MIGKTWLNRDFCLELTMHNKGQIFVCPYGKFPNRVIAARAAAAKGLPNAFNRLVELSKTDPLNYHYEAAPAKPVAIKTKGKLSSSKNKLEKITLVNGNEVSWEEFSLWSKRKQGANLIPKSKEAKEKMRKASAVRWENKEYRAKMRDIQVGHVFSDESKLKMSKLGGTGIMTPKGGVLNFV